MQGMIFHSPQLFSPPPLRLEFLSGFKIYTRLTYPGVSFSPMRLLRTFPPLEALPVIGIAVTLVRDLPADLYEELVKHPYEIR